MRKMHVMLSKRSFVPRHFKNSNQHLLPEAACEVWSTRSQQHLRQKVCSSTRNRREQEYDKQHIIHPSANITQQWSIYRNDPDTQRHFITFDLWAGKNKKSNVKLRLVMMQTCMKFYKLSWVNQRQWAVQEKFTDVRTDRRRLYHNNKNEY